MTHSPVRFTWDQEKSDATLRARGFGFAFAALIFAGPTLERDDRRRDYGERRVIAIGVALDLTVCFTDRPDAGAGTERRIISVRRSNRHERKAYYEELRAREVTDTGTS
jgi:uncharacterized DUF497 family protein